MCLNGLNLYAFKTSRSSINLFVQKVLPHMRRWRNNRDFRAVLSIDQLHETINQTIYGQLMVHNNGGIRMQIVWTNIMNEIVGATFTDNQLSSIITTNNEPLFITINQSHIPHAMNIVPNLAIIVKHRNYVSLPLVLFDNVFDFVKKDGVMCNINMCKIPHM
ncbi:uncharacterized protein [Chelonus insularis]|uniref:uncharacterized protein n=1 Tax=Chelonus insularis TaxID=460826 RepID=UPI001589BBAF|nr:uncharacterized protein LOC118065349 [Chelonus insularis]